MGGMTLLYGLLPWLLGGYAVLRWPWLRPRLVLQRLVLCALATAIAVLLIQGAYALGLRLLYDDLPAWAPNPRGASWLLPCTTAR